MNKSIFAIVAIAMLVPVAFAAPGDTRNEDQGRPNDNAALAANTDGDATAVDVGDDRFYLGSELGLWQESNGKAGLQTAETVCYFSHDDVEFTEVQDVDENGDLVFDENGDPVTHEEETDRTKVCDGNIPADDDLP
ncbi:MAG: hypothetical protein ACT4PT_11940 [Methanobacteriota archaeon]